VCPICGCSHQPRHLQPIASVHPCWCCCALWRFSFLTRGVVGGNSSYNSIAFFRHPPFKVLLHLSTSIAYLRISPFIFHPLPSFSFRLQFSSPFFAFFASIFHLLLPPLIRPLGFSFSFRPLTRPVSCSCALSHSTPFSSFQAFVVKVLASQPFFRACVFTQLCWP
jgi:hypothetical protein